MSSRSPALWLIAQIGLAALLFATMVFTPPLHGLMLAIPIGAQKSFPNWLLDRGARLVAAGPLKGSLVIEGSRAQLLGAALAHGTILIAAQPAGCGVSNSDGTQR